MEEKQKFYLTVMLSRIIFQKDDFKIATFEVAQKNDHNILEGTVLTIKGSMPKLEYGMKYKIVAYEVEDKKYGKQYQLLNLRTDFDMSDGNQVKKFLSFILTGRQIDNLFSTLKDPIQAMETGNVEELSKVKGISTYTANRIIENYNLNKDNSVAYIQLYDYGLSKLAIDRIVAHYGSPEMAVQKIKTNPYILIDEMERYGWKKADAIALNGGIAPTSKFRLVAFAKYYLNTCAQDNGNTWIDLQELRNAYTDLIPEATDLQVQEALKTLTTPILDKEPPVQYFPETNKICLTRYRNLEKEISKELKRIQAAPALSYNKNSMSQVIKEVENAQGWQFEEEQIKATQMVLDNQVSIITGGAGVGKSSSLALATKVLTHSVPYDIRQTALSGRAASRMKEITGLNGYTIHRLIGLKPESDCPEYNENHPLTCDVVILDETSMVDGVIFLKLLKAIRTGCKLVMLGDIHQLESIGICNLLKDMIHSEVIPYVMLEKIHRQAAKSGIITTATTVKQGKQIIPSITYEGEYTNGELQDLDMVVLSGNEHTQEVILDNYKKLLKQGISKDDIDVIVPMRKRGKICLNVLNLLIQDIVANKAFETAVLRYDKELDKKIEVYENDRVIVTENCYHDIYRVEDEEEVPIFNGNIGKVISIGDDSMIVDIYQLGEVTIPKRLYSCLDLGYAITCHAKQGSETPYAIIGLDSSCYTLLSKEWLYTALTRAKKHCILVGQNLSLHRAVQVSSVSNKKTWLTEFLKG